MNLLHTVHSFYIVIWWTSRHCTCAHIWLGFALLYS